MSETIERLGTPVDVATFLGLSPSTVRAFVSSAPHRLPPRVASMSAPRWVPEVCRDRAMKQSGAFKHKGGRPRSN